MFKFTLHLRAIVMLTIVVIGIITRLMTGYGAYTNPLHRFHGATMMAATSTSTAATESVFRHFKLKRRIAMETLTHFTWHLDVPHPAAVRLIAIPLEARDAFVDTRAVSPDLRPPSLA
jgi:hypothetical protein